MDSGAITSSQRRLIEDYVNDVSLTKYTQIGDKLNSKKEHRFRHYRYSRSEDRFKERDEKCNEILQVCQIPGKLEMEIAAASRTLDLKIFGLFQIDTKLSTKRSVARIILGLPN